MTGRGLTSAPLGTSHEPLRRSLEKGSDALADAMLDDLGHRIRHPAVARHRNPFHSQASEDKFLAALEEIIRPSIIPEGYNREQMEAKM